MQVVTLFGSNSGHKYQLITEAMQRLSIHGNIMLASSFYETEPWGFECAENFLNRAVVFDTLLPPSGFLRQCLNTEQQLGRQRSTGGPRYTSRPIDIDLLFCENQVIHTPELILPHPRLAERNFVLQPLMEIMPDFVHPVLQKTIATLLAECPDQLKAEKVAEENLR